MVRGGHERYMEGQPERDLRKELRQQERKLKRDQRRAERQRALEEAMADKAEAGEQEPEKHEFLECMLISP